MRTVADLVSAVSARTKPENAAAWDPVGLQLGDPEAPLASVAVCHEVTEAVVAVLEEHPVDLLVAYHPLLFEPTNRLIGGRSAGARAYRLVRAGVALVVTHTDFDAMPRGTADSLAERLGLRSVEPFGGHSEAGLPDIGRVGEFGATLATLDARVSDAFGHVGLRVTGDRDCHLDRVAVVPGSGSIFIEAAAEVAQALVTGDVSHHRAVLATDLGLAVVDPGHTATERPGMEALVGLVTEITEAEVVDLTGLDPRTWS